MAKGRREEIDIAGHRNRHSGPTGAGRDQSRPLDDSDRTFWVGLSLFFAIASFLALLGEIFLSNRLTCAAHRILLPYVP